MISKYLSRVLCSFQEGKLKKTQRLHPSNLQALNPTQGGVNYCQYFGHRLVNPHLKKKRLYLTGFYTSYLHLLESIPLDLCSESGQPRPPFSWWAANPWVRLFVLTSNTLALACSSFLPPRRRIWWIASTTGEIEFKRVRQMHLHLQEKMQFSPKLVCLLN